MARIGRMGRTRTVLFGAGVIFLGFLAALFFIGTSDGRTLFFVALVLVVLVAGGNWLSDRGSSTAHRGPVQVAAPPGPETATATEETGEAAPAVPRAGEAAPDPAAPDPAAPDPWPTPESPPPTPDPDPPPAQPSPPSPPLP